MLLNMKSCTISITGHPSSSLLNFGVIVQTVDFVALLIVGVSWSSSRTRNFHCAGWHSLIL